MMWTMLAAFTAGYHGGKLSPREAQDRDLPNAKQMTFCSFVLLTVVSSSMIVNFLPPIIIRGNTAQNSESHGLQHFVDNVSRRVLIGFPVKTAQHNGHQMQKRNSSSCCTLLSGSLVHADSDQVALDTVSPRNTRPCHSSNRTDCKTCSSISLFLFLSYASSRTCISPTSGIVAGRYTTF